MGISIIKIKPSYLYNNGKAAFLYWNQAPAEDATETLIHYNAWNWGSKLSSWEYNMLYQLCMLQTIYKRIQYIHQMIIWDKTLLKANMLLPII